MKSLTPTYEIAPYCSFKKLIDNNKIRLNIFRNRNKLVSFKRSIYDEKKMITSKTHYLDEDGNENKLIRNYFEDGSLQEKISISPQETVVTQYSVDTGQIISKEVK